MQQRLLASQFKVPWSLIYKVVFKCVTFPQWCIDDILPNSCIVLVVVLQMWRFFFFPQTHMLDEINWNWWKITWNLYVRRDTDVYKNIKCCMFSVCCQVSFFCYVLPLFSSYSSGLCGNVWTWRNDPLAKMSCCQKRFQVWEGKWCRES